MFQALFALTSGFLYVGNLLRGLARGVLALRSLHDITTHLMPTLCSPPATHLLDAPIAPLELLEELRMPSSSGGLIAIELPPLVLQSPIPTRSYQSSLVTVTPPNNLLDLVPFLLLLAFISGLVFLLPGFVYVFASIAGRISALSRLPRKNFKALSFSLVPVFILVILFSLVPNLFSTRIFSLRLHVSPASLLLLWIGPPAIASFFVLMYIISKLPICQKFSNMVVKFLQRCGLLTQPDTQTPPILTAIYEQIVNKNATYHKFAWRRSPPSEPKQDQTPTYTGDGTTSSHLEFQCREQELLNSLTQHKLELEQEVHHRLRTQQIYSAYAETQRTLRQQLENSRTREGKMKADLHAAERERKKLKDLIATLEASDVVLRADLAATVDETREAAIIFDQQSRLAAEKDHVIRSTNKDLSAVRAELQDAEDKIARLDAELECERKLRILRTKELDEHAKTRRLHEAEMRRILKKTEDVQGQLNLLDYLLSPSRARTQSLLDDAHTPRLSNYAIAIAPDDTGQPPPPPLENSIPDIRTPLLNSIARPRPYSPKSLRQTPELNPHDPTTRHSPDHTRQISAWLGRVSDSANSWRAGVESLLETISQLEAERAREAESRERSERCLQEDLAATKDELGVTQGELTSTMEELGVTQEELASTMEELGVTHEELSATKERLREAQEEVSNANRELDRERETLKDAMAHAEDVTRDLEACKAKLKVVQEARSAGIDKFCNAVNLLRQRNADLESLRAEAQASKSEAVSLSAVLRKRVEILEAEVKSLSLNRHCEETQPTQADSPLFSPTDKDPLPISHSVERSLPSPSPSPSPPSNILPISSPLQTIISLDNVPSSHDPPQSPEVSPTRHPPRPGILSPSRACSVTSLPVGSSVGSVDWPPIGPTLRPSGKNAEQDSGVRLLKTLRLPLKEVDNIPSTSATFRNPLNLPLPQIMISRPLIFPDPIPRFGVHGSASFRLSNIAALEPPDKFAPASRLHPELVSGSHRSALMLSSHTPPGSPPPRVDALTRSAPEPPLPRLLPGLLDPVIIREHAVLNEDSPCAFSKPKRGRRPNRYRAYTRPYIPTIDYGLPKGFIPDIECPAIEPPDQELDNPGGNDFAFLMPLDCLTSTPIAISRRLTSKKPEPDKSPSGGGGTDEDCDLPFLSPGWEKRVAEELGRFPERTWAVA